MQHERNALTQDRYAHTRDAEYHHQLDLAIRQLRAAQSDTAIDHYAGEKLDRAEMAIAAARTALRACTGYGAEVDDAAH